MLDSRSKPAELAVGSLRYKLNLSINRTGSMCVRSGHAALDFGVTSPALTHPNWDFHRRDAAVPREPENFLFEAISPSSVHVIYAGTPSHLFFLNNATSEWSLLSAPVEAGSRWKASTLENEIIFANNVLGGFGVRYSTIGGPTLGIVLAGSVDGDDVTHAQVINRARVVVTFSDVVLLMNVNVAGVEYRSRVMWSDYKIGHDFVTKIESVAAFQDLDYGDEILAAAEMQGALYIFTTQAIWRCTLAGAAADKIFDFRKIYSEPKNQTGCLVYPNTLCTDGRQLFWMGSDTIWTFNPYIIAPESPDWMLKGSGAQFSEDNVDRMDRRCCEAIIGEFHPDTKEIVFSYPKAGLPEATCLNDRCLVLNTEYHTADLMDTGYSALANFRFKPGGEAQDCTVQKYFIGASTVDFCLKSIGGVFYRETVTLVGGDPANDIPDSAYATTQVGYYARVVGACPFGSPSEEKVVRELLVDHETPSNDLAKDNRLALRIGNHFNLVDPMATSARCAPQWHVIDPLPLKCPDEATIAAMTLAGERPSDPLAFTIWEIANRHFFDLKVTAFDGAPPIKHESSWSALRWDVKSV